MYQKEKRKLKYELQDKVYQKQNKTIKRQYVTNYLNSHPCIDCGEKDIEVLEFDHVKGVKRKAISNLIMQSYSIETLIIEIDKCEVRCANCHRRITKKRRRDAII